ncbi:MAG: hypothetical protein ABI036_04995 [Fibrobacteria bacterium]
MKAVPAIVSTAGACALAFALCASKCVHTTEIVPYIQEICDDDIDNDTDGDKDCQDSDCDAACAVSVLINPISTITGDSLTVTGTHLHATGIALSIFPVGTAGSVTLTENTWTGHLALLSDRTTYTLTAIAADAQGRKDTASVQFVRGN